MLGESFYGCFSGFRRPPGSSAPLPAPPTDATAAAASSSSSSSSIVFRNFTSLFDPISDSDGPAGTLSSAADASCPSRRDLSAAIASRRLLPASPGRSNSIVDSASVAIAVPTYSPDPYRDFRLSMEEMVKALGLDAGGGGSAARYRAYLDELLLCYLALNRKNAHEYIISAFTDLILALEPGGDCPGAARPQSDERA